MDGLILILALTVFSFGYYAYYIFKQKQVYKPLDWKDLALIKMKLQLITPRQFEVFCTSLFTLRGEHAETTQTTGDFGRDIIVYHKDGSKTFVECKLYDKEKCSVVTRPIAMKLAGSMWHEKKNKGVKVKGMIITTSRFTDDCKEYCKDMGIELVDTNGILKMCEEIGTTKVLLALDITKSYLLEEEYIIEQENMELA